MNGYERIQAALNGNRPDTTPIMLHNFPMAVAEAGIDMAEYRCDPKAIAQCMIEAVESYQYDGVVVDIDTATLAGAVGVPIDFPHNEPARCVAGCLETLETVDELKPIDVGSYRGVQVWLEATQLLVDHFQGEIFVRGNCDQCPFSLASMMRTPQQWMMDLMDPEAEPYIFRLLDYCLEVARQFLTLMSQTGAAMLSNGDSPAGPDMISPRMYKQYAWPYEKQIADHAHSLNLPYLLHICGNTDSIVERMVATGADCLELDYKTEVQLVHDTMQEKAVFVGNIDPSGVLALGSVELVRQKTRELLEVFSDTPRFILNAGCAIPASTPSANLRAMIRTAREF